MPLFLQKLKNRAAPTAKTDDSDSPSDKHVRQPQQPKPPKKDPWYRRIPDKTTNPPFRAGEEVSYLPFRIGRWGPQPSKPADSAAAARPRSPSPAEVTLPRRPRALSPVADVDSADEGPMYSAPDAGEDAVLRASPASSTPEPVRTPQRHSFAAQMELDPPPPGAPVSFGPNDPAAGAALRHQLNLSRFGEMVEQSPTAPPQRRLFRFSLPRHRRRGQTDGSRPRPSRRHTFAGLRRSFASAGKQIIGRKRSRAQVDDGNQTRSGTFGVRRMTNIIECPRLRMRIPDGHLLRAIDQEFEEPVTKATRAENNVPIRSNSFMNDDGMDVVSVVIKQWDGGPHVDEADEVPRITMARRVRPPPTWNGEEAHDVRRYLVLAEDEHVAMKSS